VPRKGPTEQDVLRIVMDRGNEGILQSALWREMKADSREGSRAILRLERKRLIERKRELHSGRWTYRVFARRKYSTIDSIVDVPAPSVILKPDALSQLRLTRPHARN
jgi:hypothetical protein